MSTLGERIRHVRDNVLKINQAVFAQRLGFSRVATISDYEKDKRSPDITTLRKIADVGTVTLEWLLTGDGPVSIHEMTEQLEAKETGGTVYGGDFVKAEVFDSASAGGPGEFPAEEPVDFIYIPKKDHKEGIVAIRVRGDGMSPVVRDGATVGIDTTDRRIVSGRLYAVWLNYEGVAIKKVYVYPDKVVLKPENPTFPETAIPTTGPKGEEFIIGRVAWIYQRC